jgi:hypothetical protein
VAHLSHGRGGARAQCVLYPPAENQHITVVRKNRFYAVPVFPKGSATPYSPAEIDGCVSIVNACVCVCVYVYRVVADT